MADGVVIEVELVSEVEESTGDVESESLVEFTVQTWHLRYDNGTESVLTVNGNYDAESILVAINGES